MVFSRAQSAFGLLAWLFFACASKQESDAEAPPQEGSGGTSTMAGSGVSVAASTSNEVGVSAGGAASVGGAASAGSAVSTSGAAHVSGASAIGPAEEFEQDCLARAESSCEQCLCSSCTEQLRACAATEGCPELVVCIRDHHCAGIACYCGTFDAIACANGEANGPCKAAILDAPGSRLPTLINPSAGPASDAAVDISHCEQPGQPCTEACASK